MPKWQKWQSVALTTVTLHSIECMTSTSRDDPDAGYGNGGMKDKRLPALASMLPCLLPRPEFVWNRLCIEPASTGIAYCLILDAGLMPAFWNIVSCSNWEV